MFGAKPSQDTSKGSMGQSSSVGATEDASRLFTRNSSKEKAMTAQGP